MGLESAEVDCCCEHQEELPSEVYETICLACGAIYDKEGDFVCYKDERK